ncbi:MAG TPA: acetylglutamate kinase [Henriciella marina]|uniref:acetylglutamate kinase n=1 Tax=Henriciella sp. TaxID=1968823 RepID=UPI00183D5430|nr:acetylglutamate kinase [Henriciella sp.]HIG21933.1 acetylglutamate kinase [Henriciella sp.]HIK64236.1 acetylglutamate kinase [Henriciella marina]
MSDTPQIPAQFTAETLSEALPYIQRYDRQTVVIKYGGHAMVDEALSEAFARDVVLLKHLGVNPVIVHGGGPQIASLLDRLSIKSEFRDGLRVTDDATMEVVEMVLSGPINKSIVRAINKAGGKAVGLSGSDADMMRVKRATRTSRDPDSHVEQVIDLGYVGEPEAVDVAVLKLLTNYDHDFIPVIAPVGVDANGKRYNVNADTAAGAIASALEATRLLLLTDVAGVLDGKKELIRELRADDVPALVRDGVASGGMIPKLETAASAVKNGVGGAVILDGRAKHALLMELFTEHGAGTIVL